MGFLSALFGKSKSQASDGKVIPEAVADTKEEITPTIEEPVEASNTKGEETVSANYKFETLQLHVGQEEADPVSGDTISYDCSYNTLELSFGAEDDLNVVYDRFRRYYLFIQERLDSAGHTLTGMGVNPYWRVNRCEPIANGRYRMLLHHLQSYKRYPGGLDFHDVPQFGLFSCASQIQLDAEEDTVIEALNTFSRLEPWKALLFANSPWGDFLCASSRCVRSWRPPPSMRVLWRNCPH